MNSILRDGGRPCCKHDAERDGLVDQARTRRRTTQLLANGLSPPYAASGGRASGSIVGQPRCAAPMLQAAEQLVREGDVDRLHKWLSHRSAAGARRHHPILRTKIEARHAEFQARLKKR